MNSRQGVGGGGLHRDIVRVIVERITDIEAQGVPWFKKFGKMLWGSGLVSLGRK